MSLAQKWDGYAKQIANWPDGKPVLLKDFIKRAFYAGAEAVITANHNEGQMLGDIRAEIDRFKEP